MDGGIKKAPAHHGELGLLFVECNQPKGGLITLQR
jgi:hypothetical protein